MLKMLWKLSGKEDNLWIQWIHCYYIHKKDLMTILVKTWHLGIFKGILKPRQLVNNPRVWNKFWRMSMFLTKTTYNIFKERFHIIEWEKIMQGNMDRPNVLFTMWMACHYSLVAKERMHKFGFLADDKCYFCANQETTTLALWVCTNKKNMVDYFGLAADKTRTPRMGSRTKMGPSNVQKETILFKCVFAETINLSWKSWNNIYFGEKVNINTICPQIINNIIQGCWLKSNLRYHIGRLLIP